ncbi:MAG: TRAP transporter large permease subunit, partial [Chloroflexi bacterium]|nr:TRAP transporter large permease subunit [Chloroflexota bacterium]
IVGPALQQLGVADFAAAMFVFYYAVLSEVSPPTALSPFAAAAITGGKAVKTMWLTWKYTLPAFLVPFVFVLAPQGEGLLLEGDLLTIVIACISGALAVAALAVVTGAWVLGPATWPERALFGAGTLALLVTEPVWIGFGMVAMVMGLGLHLVRRRRGAAGLA